MNPPPQRTQHDAASSLRIFADINATMTLLLKELDITPRTAPQTFPRGDVYAVPRYDGAGARLPADTPDSATTLDLTDGSAVVLADGPYEGDSGEVVSSTPFFYTIRFMHNLKGKKAGGMKRPFERKLGKWMLAAATRAGGGLEKLPVVNPKKSEHEG
ncbi:hypothetical protein TeGR_g8646 [Tetraparma gracilis]|uniref:Uncharacterized protein n=1 Tax=Tetraparma gracilis TaxID=2962635 RepID=A0ABQ6MK85_9STRA|nr:hypothetical protein TeGR_g8646 [Tetraparma gracilis]